eukprot:gb/GEZN01007240.1/.p1 GENE.gb/GEZN01007240.1/~~gb/GEZN01007240.1/.p1  ORF type:complete len:290 (-),score=24.84 gb/GEZN01007240.1/:552-1421(-)
MFAYGPMGQSLTESKALMTGVLKKRQVEGWLYGATLGACEDAALSGSDSTAGAAGSGPAETATKLMFASPTGTAGDIIKGSLLCWPPSIFSDKVAAADKLFGYDSKDPKQGKLRRGSVSVVLADGSSVSALWYFDECPEIDMFDRAREAIKASSPASSVYIGCDSLQYRKGNNFRARYSTVIVLHLDSKHGCQLFHKTVDLRDYDNLRQRLLNEVMYAIEAANHVMDVIGERKLEIHLDINSDARHKSNLALKEATGYVRGILNIVPKFKPDAFAATSAADHLAHCHVG